MPAKPFYSLEEASARLGKSADEIKALVRDGSLREFRDAGKVFFKAEDVERLAAPPAGPGDSGEILLEPAGEPEAPGDLTALSDTGGGTSIIGLEPLEEEPREEKKQEDTVITASGIGVFDDDELEIDADPMAKTQITTGAMDDQVTLEGAGSGSGLLDLAREADDTALGADLLDEIYPGEEAVEAPEEAAPEAEAPVAAAAPAEEKEAELAEVEAGEVLVPVAAPTGDPLEGAFAGLLVGGLIALAVASTVVAGLVQGYLPSFGQFLGQGGMSFYLFTVGGSVLVAVLALVLGWFVGKAFNPRRR